MISIINYQQQNLHMASILKRKEQVSELRKAHFPFGFQDNKNVRSEYQKEYLQNPIDTVISSGNKNSNFTIGSNEQAMAKFQYQSQFKEKYPEHPYQHKEAIQKSNDKNNFILGFGNNDKSTNYNNQFKQKPFQRVKPVNQRQIHVDLGDTLVDFTTSYNKFYDGAQGAKPQKIQNNLATTNMILGSDKQSYTTSNAAQYNQKPINLNQGNSRSYGTNILLGQDNPAFLSQNKNQFSHKNTHYENVDKSKVLDFRSAHFKLGFPAQKSDNISQAQQQYCEKDIPMNQVYGNRPTNVQLKYQDNNYYVSSYGQNFKGQKGERAQLLNGNGRSSNLVIGLGKQIYNSQAHDQFGFKTTQYIRGKGQEGRLQLGDGNRQFLTHYQQTHDNKFNSHQPSSLSKEQIDKMKRQHLVKGFDEVNYQLHSQKYGQGRGDGRNKLSRQTIDKMRGTNIVNGDQNKFYGTTTHKQAYNWKKNDDF